MNISNNDDREKQIIEISEWRCPEENGVTLLGAPMKPKALMGISSESICGEEKTAQSRKALRQEASACAICKKRLFQNTNKRICELCSFDGSKKEATFERPIVICPFCYDAMNIRMTYWLGKLKNGKYDNKYALKVVKHALKLVAKYNKASGRDLRVSAAYLASAGESLRVDILKLLKRYNVKLFGLKIHYPLHGWKYLYNGVTYKLSSFNSIQWLKTWFKVNESQTGIVLRDTDAPRIGFNSKREGVVLWGTSIDEWNLRVEEAELQRAARGDEEEEMVAPGTSLFVAYDIETVDHWECLEDKGAPLLTMPNVPRALHGEGMQPRTIYGATVWDFMRKQCMERAGNRSEVSGIESISEKLQAHELFEYDYLKQEGVFVRCVALTGMEHDFIHSGRMVTLYKEGAPKYTKEYVLKTVENGFKIINEYNESHSGQPPLRVYWSILNLLKTDLDEDVRALIKRYSIKFYREHIKKNKYWRGWHVIVGTNRYDTPYSNKRDWIEAMEKASAADSERNGSVI